MKATVTAVVVHYRGAGHVQRCVESCLADPAVARIVIVDNEGVADDLRRAFADSRVRVLAVGANAGYGRAANAGLAESRSPGVLVLNQDVVLPPGTVGPLLDVGRAMGAWLVAPRLMDDRGVIAVAKDRLPWPLPWRPPAQDSRVAPGRYVPWVPGAAVLLMPGHTELRFDERYFMYVEDEDLCARVWAAGGRVVLAADVVVRHVGGTAATQRWSRSAIALRVHFGRIRMVHAHRGTTFAAAHAARSLVSAVGRATRRLAGACRLRADG